MNERLTTRNLADILAIQTGMEKEQAEKFIEVLSSYITRGIETNKFVKVLGLGTFKVVLVRERESVHIHTGERFVIPAHHKLSFIPDKSLKEQINRPFAFFEPIEATQEISFLSLKNQPAGDKTDSDIEHEAFDYNEDPEDPAVIFNEDEEPDELPIEIEAYQPVSEDTQPVPDDSPTIPDDYPPATEDYRFVSGEISAVSETVQPAEEEFQLVSEDALPASEDMPAAENSRYTVEDFRLGIPPAPGDTPDDTDRIDYSAADPDREKTSNMDMNKRRKTIKTKVVAPLWLWFLLLPFLVLAGAVIGSYVFLHYNADTSNAGLSEDNTVAVVDGLHDTDATIPLPIGVKPDTDDSEINGPDNDETYPQPDPAPVAADSISDTVNVEAKNEKRVIDWFAPSNENTEPKQADKPSTTTSTPATSKQTEQKSSDKTTPATGTAANKPQTAPAEKVIPARVRMTAGSSLTQIAMEHYGDKIFWVYIYEYNKSRIKDFNRIPVGTEIRLPQPKTYGINAKSKTSVQKARKKQSELLKWDKWDDYQ